MAPSETPLNAEGIARAVTSLPAAVFIGDVSGPLNAEASALAEKLDPKLEDIKVGERVRSACSRALASFVH